jgi:2,3-bisphosphoglycerate-independent phosphoglycerate mutase
MSAFEITDHVCKVIKQQIYDCIIVNFANADMVAHTGSFEATKKAIESLDTCLEKITKLASSVKGVTIITADHGKAEEMVNLKTGGIDTEHTANPVPFIVVGELFKDKQDLELSVGLLADVAPTILTLLRLRKPDSMTGNDLLL